jgi:hypothetical protein
VRLRTRLRRAREAVRRAFPRRLPAWRQPAQAPTGPGDRATMARDQAEIAVDRTGELRRVAAAERLGARSARSVRVVVADWRPPYPGWSGRLAPLPGVRRHEFDVPSGRGRATVTVILAEPLPVARVVAAMRPLLEPVRRPGPSGGDGARPMVDVGAADPRGRQRYGSGLPSGELLLDSEGGWEVARVADGTTVVAGRAGEPLDERQRAVLAELGLITLQRQPRSGAAGSGPDHLIHRRDLEVVVQLAMTGVVLHAPDLLRIDAQSKGARETPSVAAGEPGRVGPADPPTGLVAELAEILTTPLPGDDPLDWEIRSVRQRRAAMRHHSAGLAPPPVSALLVSKRPQLLIGQVAVLAAQTYPDLEIVVGLHDVDEPTGLHAMAGHRPLRVIRIPAERNLGEALQATTSAAHAVLLTKVDDDDRYGPEHVWDLVLAHHYSGATVVGRGAEFVYVEPDYLTVRRRMGAEFYTDTVAGGTITLHRDDLAAAGGWPPVPRHVDRAMLDRVLAGGGLVYRTHPIGFIYTRHGDGHTWQAEKDYFLHDAQRTWRGLPPHAEFGTT